MSRSGTKATKTTTIPHIMRENETTGRVDNFRKAARQMSGAYAGRRFNDTDIYKIVEADLLGGVEVVKAGGLTFVPYYAWANRGQGEMAVWVPDSAGGST